MIETNEQEVRKAVRRHIAVSVAAAVGILALVLMSGLSPKMVVAAAIVIALVVAGTGTHLFSERAAIQLLIGFTVFFVFMLISWSYESFTDDIEGTIHGTYDVPGAAAEETH